MLIEIDNAYNLLGHLSKTDGAKNVLDWAKVLHEKASKIFSR